MNQIKTTDEKIDEFIEITKNILKQYRLKKGKFLYIVSIIFIFNFYNKCQLNVEKQ